MELFRTCRRPPSPSSRASPARRQRWALAFDMRYAALGKAVFAAGGGVGIIRAAAERSGSRLVGWGRRAGPRGHPRRMNIDAATAEIWVCRSPRCARELRRFVDKLPPHRVVSARAIANAKRAVDAALDVSGKTCDRLAHRGSAVSRDPRAAGRPATATGSDRRRRPHREFELGGLRPPS